MRSSHRSIAVTCLIAVALILIVSGGCQEPVGMGGGTNQSDAVTVSLDDARELIGDEPKQIQVQHILIAFRGTLPDKVISRSKEEAEVLAQKLLKRAKEGEDFRDLVREYSDDGDWPYTIANLGQPSKSSLDRSKVIYKREEMVNAFGDVGFKLERDEIGLAEHNSENSPYGWHIIKRIK